jgi:predicted RNA methylase
MIYSITIFVFILALLAFLSLMGSALYYGIGPVVTTPKVRRALFGLMPNQVSGKMYELGAGFGSLAFPLADRYKEAEVIAVEASPLPWLWMRIRLYLSPRVNLKLIYKDFFDLPLSDAAVIVCYLYPQAMDKLERKIRKESQAVLVFTHTFALPSHAPIASQNAHDIYCTPVYGYRLTNICKSRSSRP